MLRREEMEQCGGEWCERKGAELEGERQEEGKGWGQRCQKLALDR